MHCLDHRIIHIRTNGVSGETLFLGRQILWLGMILSQNTCRYRYGGGARRYVLNHYGIRTNLGAFAYRYRPQYFGSRPYYYVFLQCGMALAFIPRSAAQGYTVIQGAVVAYFSSFSNDDTHAVINKHAPPNEGTRMNLDTSQTACQMCSEACQPLEVRTP